MVRQANVKNAKLVNADSEPEPQLDMVDGFLRNGPPALISVIVHLIVLIVLAILSMSMTRDEPLVLQIDPAAEEDAMELDSMVIETVDAPAPAEAELETEVPVPMNDAPVTFASTTIQPDLNGLGIRIGEGDFTPSFSNRIDDARRNGIEIVIVFDSTGSMRGEIEQVKTRIKQVGSAVLRKIPRAKFSLATYRDQTDDYVVRGIPLNDSMDSVTEFISGVSAGGGGDHPEAVQAGMTWATHYNQYRRNAQKVMLIFGDAPPHSADLPQCLKLAAKFRDSGKASVHTVTCKRNQPLSEFYQIAQAGGGEAFVMGNVQRLMEQLLVIAFGAEHRAEVLKFFELSEGGNQPNTRRRLTRGWRRR